MTFQPWMPPALVHRHEDAQPVVTGEAEEKGSANLFLELYLKIECPACVRASLPVPEKVEGAGPRRSVPPASA